MTKTGHSTKHKVVYAQNCKKEKLHVFLEAWRL